MVSFWPWKGDDNSPASFEKTLSALSDKIIKTNSKLDSLRQRSRRYGALWTLYTTFAYLLCTVVLILVVGWREWGLAEYTGVIGGPIVIYLVRLAITTAYSLRISKIQSQSDALQQQRDVTIEKLKSATRYNTTQELLKKYGGTPPSKDRSNESTPRNGKTKQTTPTISGQPRTNFVPPATANIPGRNRLVSSPSTPQQATPRSHDQHGQDEPSSAITAASPLPDPSTMMSPSAEFAPNAFSSAPQYAQPGEGPKWYDRLMDVLLGEDETLPRNRLALICHQCRLVNGQAPPGVQRLEEVGKWRCAGCGFLNGEEKEETRLLKEIKEEAKSMPEDKHASVNEDVTDESAGEGSDYEQEGKQEGNQESTESGEEHPSMRRRMTGAQKGPDGAKRRSGRIKKRAKG